ncbi:MAG TPA: sterol desaturase family protein [Flavobacteriales bacterium]|nr:sterol desaturase family protein [Flavobacteriales bacterium]HCA82924.1 sterol desaturase family protein [Flavobacteriales bacterium]HRE75340.1 sterol desaturase family protein [Flavobacteriales bacterium]HRE95831.1 sterol desaturase family protein [Flavobacteriales bacterium]HRJ35165.1 sterol desaturase family protein [Flavobacteriales bacterium]
MQNFNETVLFLITTPLFVIFIGLEIIVSNAQRNHRYSSLGFWENMYLMIINTGIDLGMRIVALYFFTELLTVRFFEWEYSVIYWILLFVFEDLTFWTIHYVDHYVRLFWAVHVTHHNSQEYNLTVGLRSSLFEPLYRFLYFIPMVLGGFRVEDIFFAYSVTQLYGVFLHTQYVKNFGPLDYLFISPSQHRVHHGSNVRYLDKNMGMFLNIWDKLFGTYEKETEQVVYGITKNIESHDPRTVIFHEFKSIADDVRNAPTFKAKFMYIFGPPGWSHDGSRKTSKQLRKELHFQGNK